MGRAAAMIKSVTVLTMLSLSAASPASAQLGKLKKMATDKAKEAAGVKEPEGAQKGGGAKVDYTITDERVTAIFSALSPYVETAKRQLAEAEQEKAVAGIKADHEAKVQKVTDCMSKFAQSAGMPDMGWTQTPKGEALQAKLVALGKRLGTMQASNTRAQLALADSTTVLTTQQMSMMYPKSNCGAIPYMPKALLDYAAARQERLSKGTGESAPRGDDAFVVPADKRGGMTPGQFGRIREAMAIWLLQQSGDLPPTAYKFTDAEKAVLTAKAAQLKDLTPLFKANTLTWAGWSDIKSW